MTHIGPSRSQRLVENCPLPWARCHDNLFPFLFCFLAGVATRQWHADEWSCQSSSCSWSWALHVNFQTIVKEEETQTSIAWKPVFKKGKKHSTHGRLRKWITWKWHNQLLREPQKLCKEQHGFFDCRKAAASTRWVACTWRAQQQPVSNYTEGRMKDRDENEHLIKQHRPGEKKHFVS